MSVEVLSKRIDLRERPSLSVDGASPSAGVVAVIDPKEKRRELVAYRHFYLSTP